MSRHDFLVSGQLERSGAGYLACLMGAMRQADSDNYRKLAGLFPDVAQEIQERYSAPGGLLKCEQELEAFERPR